MKTLKNFEKNLGVLPWIYYVTCKFNSLLVILKILDSFWKQRSTYFKIKNPVDPNYLSEIGYYKCARTKKLESDSTVIAH